MMSDYPPEVYRVLELAERYTKEGDVPGELKDALFFCTGEGWVKLRKVADVLQLKDREGPMKDGPIGLVLPGDGMPNAPFRLLLEGKGRAVLALRRMKPAETPAEDVDWADYREGTQGPLLTVTYISERYAIPGSAWSKKGDELAEEARKTRKKNPEGRGYVYRCDIVHRMANRKEGDE